jgi:hypothetical protein
VNKRFLIRREGSVDTVLKSTGDRVDGITWLAGYQDGIDALPFETRAGCIQAPRGFQGRVAPLER